MIRAAIYARYSTDKQDARSIEDQIRRCRAVAVSRGWEVVGEYSDAAISGGTTDRINLQRLLKDANRSEFETVLVDDLSRLSRDMGDTWRIIYGGLAAARVNLFDCTAGVASDAKGSRLVIGALSLVNDTFRELIRTETHRGLEGRALAGFATGGRTYGFKTVPEENPADMFHPRKIRVIHPDESKVILRIFKAFADGAGTKEIAASLNEDGIPAPHDGGRGNKLSKGWGHTTVRHMLRNEKYRGVFIWNRHKFQQIPGTNSHRHVPRPESEHVRKEIPELRIIDEILWKRVEKLIGAKRTRQNARLGTGKKPGNLLSGLLKCGVCGGSYVVLSRKTTAATTHTRLGCGISRSRGTTICANDRTILAERVEQVVIDALKRTLSKPELMDSVIDGFNEHLNEVAKNDGMKDLQKQLRVAEQRLANITDAFAQAGFSEAIVRQVHIEEESVAKVKANISALKADKRSKVLPHPEAIKRYVEQLHQLLTKDDVGAIRTAIVRHMPPVVITPISDRGWKLSGALGISLQLNEPQESGENRQKTDGRSVSSGRRDRD